MSNASLALQKAIFAALVADAGVGALVGDRVYDAPPRDAVFPYVSFGVIAAADWSTGTEDGAEHEIALHVWSRGRGKSECLVIAGALEFALHDAPLALDGHALVNLRFASADARRDSDGITFHATARFRAVTEPSG